MKFTPLLLIFGIIFAATAIPTFAQVEEAVIPDWLRQNAGWWADRQITDEEFVNGISYLLSTGVINVETPRELEYKSQIAQLKQEKVQLESTNREVIDQLERVDDYLDSKAISVPQEVWLGTTPTNQTIEEPTEIEAITAKISSEYIDGKITFQEFLQQTQTLIDDGKIPRFNVTKSNLNVTGEPPNLKNALYYGTHDNFLKVIQELMKYGYLN